MVDSVLEIITEEEVEIFRFPLFGKCDKLDWGKYDFSR